MFVSISQVIGCEDRLRNDLYCVGWGVKLCSNQTKYTIAVLVSGARLRRVILRCARSSAPRAAGAVWKSAGSVHSAADRSISDAPRWANSSGRHTTLQLADGLADSEGGGVPSQRFLEDRTSRRKRARCAD